MARPRTPTNVLELKGAFKKNPQRARKHEPVPTAGIGPAHESLNKRQQRLWDQFVEICPPGVLGNSDRLSLMVAIGLLDMYIDLGRDMPANKLSLMMSLFGKFGMTPSERSKIVVPKGKEKNPFADLG